MKPREVEALLWEHRDAARAGAWDAKVPTADLDDITQEALILTWRRLTAGTLTLPADRAAAGRLLRAFLRQTAFRIGTRAAKRLRRHVSRAVEDLPLPVVDPEPRLDARAELREMVEGTGIRELERGMPLDVYVARDRTVSPATLATRRFRLRGGPGVRRRK